MLPVRQLTYKPIILNSLVRFSLREMKDGELDQMSGTKDCRERPSATEVERERRDEELSQKQEFTARKKYGQLPKM